MTNERSSRTAVYLLLATIGATMYAGDIDLGPVSLRVYLYLILGVWMVGGSVLGGKPLVPDSRATLLLVSYGIFVTWSVIAMVLQQVPLPLLVAKTVNYHAVAFLTAVLTLFIVRTRNDVSIFLRGFVVIVLLSCAVAILQWRRVPEAWSLWHALRPHAPAVLGEPGMGLGPDGAPIRLTIAGLFGTAVVFGYYLSVFAPVVFRRFMIRRSVATWTALALTIGGLYVVQQRSSLLAVVVCCSLLLLAQMRQRGRRLRMVGVVVALAAFVTVLAVATRPAEDAGVQPVNRYLRMTDSGRLQVAKIALSYFIEHPFIGGALNYKLFYADEQTVDTRYEAVSPHNIFLNAAVSYGFPGLLLIVVFVAQLVVLMMRTWTAARARGDWTSMTLVTTLLGYLISTQFHNASFVTGDVLPWVLIGLMLTASAPENAESRAVASRPIDMEPVRA